MVKTPRLFDLAFIESVRPAEYDDAENGESNDRAHRQENGWIGPVGEFDAQSRTIPRNY